MLYRITLCVVPTVLFLIAARQIRKYRESKWGKCKNRNNLKGKIVLITGANSGIGLEVAKELAARNAEIILACRTLENANLAAKKIRQSLLPNNISPILVPMEVDLGSLKSVKKFADQIMHNHFEINILINNAGVAYPRNQRLQTVDGVEIHFGINHLGHFYLTLLLQELLEKSQARVIVVASTLHEKGKLDLKAIKNMDFEDGENLYANSKLANVYSARKFASIMKEKGVNVYSVCPGWVYTNLFRHSFKWYHYLFIAPIAFFYMKTPKQGAETVIYCATESLDELESGEIYADCKKYNSKTIFFDRIASELWEESTEIINLNYESIENNFFRKIGLSRIEKTAPKEQTS